MNCKPGDLALIVGTVGAVGSEHIGKVCEVLFWVEDGGAYYCPYTQMGFISEVTGWFTFLEKDKLVGIKLDRHLMPIRPQPDLITNEREAQTS